MNDDWGFAPDRAGGVAGSGGSAYDTVATVWGGRRPRLFAASVGNGLSSRVWLSVAGATSVVKNGFGGVVVFGSDCIDRLQILQISLAF
jgi:hypothetical protein